MAHKLGSPGPEFARVRRFLLMLGHNFISGTGGFLRYLVVFVKLLDRFSVDFRKAQDRDLVVNIRIIVYFSLESRKSIGHEVLHSGAMATSK